MIINFFEVVIIEEVVYQEVYQVLYMYSVQRYFQFKNYSKYLLRYDTAAAQSCTSK